MQLARTGPFSLVHKGSVSDPMPRRPRLLFPYLRTPQLGQTSSMRYIATGKIVHLPLLDSNCSSHLILPIGGTQLSYKQTARARTHVDSSGLLVVVETNVLTDMEAEQGGVYAIVTTASSTPFNTHQPLSWVPKAGQPPAQEVSPGVTREQLLLTSECAGLDAAVTYAFEGPDMRHICNLSRGTYVVVAQNGFFYVRLVTGRNIFDLMLAPGQRLFVPAPMQLDVTSATFSATGARRLMLLKLGS